ncbi:MAG: hypothetical protein F6K31_20160 [Symploca sp. SIO2G7]|nr:hypothetical protein [Symploca sp. SIO2G7]
MKNWMFATSPKDQKDSQAKAINLDNIDYIKIYTDPTKASWTNVTVFFNGGKKTKLYGQDAIYLIGMLKILQKIRQAQVSHMLDHLGDSKQLENIDNEISQVYTCLTTEQVDNLIK